MKKLAFLFIVGFVTSYSQAQGLSYGINGGVNTYDLETSENSALRPIGKVDLGINFGVFLDYSLSKAIGIKTDVIVNSVRDRYGFFDGSENGTTFYVKVNTVQIAPKFKFYPGKNYHESFYLMAGPRITFVNNVKGEDGDKIDDFYKKSNFGGQLGFGYDVLKFLAVDLIADLTLSDPLEMEYDSQKLFSAFITLNLNLESLINK